MVFAKQASLSSLLEGAVSNRLSKHTLICRAARISVSCRNPPLPLLCARRLLFISPLIHTGTAGLGWGDDVTCLKESFVLRRLFFRSTQGSPLWFTVFLG